VMLLGLPIVCHQDYFLLLTLSAVTPHPEAAGNPSCCVHSCHPNALPAQDQLVSPLPPPAGLSRWLSGVVAVAEVRRQRVSHFIINITSSASPLPRWMSNRNAVSTSLGSKANADATRAGYRYDEADMGPNPMICRPIGFSAAATPVRVLQLHLAASWLIAPGCRTGSRKQDQHESCWGHHWPWSVGCW